MNMRAFVMICVTFLCSAAWSVGCEPTTPKSEGPVADSQRGGDSSSPDGPGLSDTAKTPDVSPIDQGGVDALTDTAPAPDVVPDAAPAPDAVVVPWPDNLTVDSAPDVAAGDIVAVERLPSDVPPSPTQCQGKATPKKLDEVITFTHNKINRRYRIHIPKSYDPTKPMPVIINMHGYTSDSWQQSLLTKMDKHADAHGYVVVYPEGTRLVKSWNAGKCCPPGGANKADDVGFINALIDRLEGALCVDKRRIYATGMSNGGFMTNRLACELSHRIAAFGPVAGHLLFEPCKPSRPIPLMHFHGSDDGIVPYKGGGATSFPSVQASIDFWVKHNKCDPKPTRTFAKGDATCDTYGSCQAGVTVTLCTIHGGGHTWPGGLVIPAGKTSKDINATDELWKFFQRFPLP